MVPGGWTEETMQCLAIDWPDGEPQPRGKRLRCEAAAERAARRVLERHGIEDYGAAYRAYRQQMEIDADAPMTGLAAAWAEAQAAADRAAYRAYGRPAAQTWDGLWPVLRGW
jgi:hypothetical protein